MRYDDFRRSEDIEDRRDEGGGMGGGMGGGFGLPMGRGGLGIGTIIVLGIVGYALGIDPRLLIGGAEILTGGGGQIQQPYQAPRPTANRGAPTDATGKFVSAILGSTEVQWKDIFVKEG